MLDNRVRDCKFYLLEINKKRNKTKFQDTYNNKWTKTESTNQSKNLK